jgi:hypothetical protein
MVGHNKKICPVNKPLAVDAFVPITPSSLQLPHKPIVIASETELAALTIPDEMVGLHAKYVRSHGSERATLITICTDNHAVFLDVGSLPFVCLRNWLETFLSVCPSVIVLGQASPNLLTSTFG